MQQEKKRFGLIGHPVGHSLSQAMHTAVFQELGLPHTYEALDIEPKDLTNFMKTAKQARGTAEQYDGFNVTIPHKVEAMNHVDRLGQSAKAIQAVNTISFGDEIVGYNTDAIGFARSLEERAIDPSERNVLVVGSGGVSRAILYQLIQYDANITLTNRTRQKAEDLVKQLQATDKIKIIDYTPENLTQALQDTYLIVNTTSIGMLPNTENSPIPKQALKPDHVIFDAIYNPINTKLIKDAKAIGCETISGVSMLVHQGAESLKIWLGIEPPIETMRNAVIKGLTS